MRNVLITGATGGIGASLVEKFHSANYYIYASGTNLEKLQNLKEKYKSRIACVKCDLVDKNQIESMIEEFNKINGQIEILINNAGITHDNLIMRMKDDDWNKVINVNLNSNFQLTKLILKYMIKNKWGRIVNITSDAATIGNPGQSNYVASKAAIEGLTKTIANEVARRGITVNCVSPGFIKTEILNTIDSSKLETMIQKVPVGRMGNSNEVADAVFFLSSEESSYITGQVLHINGGLTM